MSFLYSTSCFQAGSTRINGPRVDNTALKKNTAHRSEVLGKIPYGLSKMPCRRIQVNLKSISMIDVQLFSGNICTSRGFLRSFFEGFQSMKKFFAILFVGCIPLI